MKIAAKYIPADIKQRYNLQDKIIDGYIYIKIKRGMYGLKQAAILAHEQLVENLKTIWLSSYSKHQFLETYNKTN